MFVWLVNDELEQVGDRLCVPLLEIGLGIDELRFLLLDLSLIPLSGNESCLFIIVELLNDISDDFVHDSSKLSLSRLSIDADSSDDFIR